MSEARQEIRAAVWSKASAVTQADIAAVRETKNLCAEEQSLLAKTICEYLVEAHLSADSAEPQVLLEAAQRVGNLFSHAAVRRGWGDQSPFDVQHVDPYAEGVLLALEHHPDQELAAEAAMFVRIDRNRAEHKQGHSGTPLDAIGPVTPTPQHHPR